MPAPHSYAGLTVAGIGRLTTGHCCQQPLSSARTATVRFLTIGRASRGQKGCQSQIS